MAGGTGRDDVAGRYVALGDSISIDAYAGGPGRGAASLLYRNRDEDFPAWHGRDLATSRPDLGLWLLAMDGGTTRTLLDVQLPALEASGVRPGVVTLTVGGNDLLGAYGDTRAALDVVRTVGARVRQGLARMRALAGADTPVVVGTVYDPSDGTGDAVRLGLPPWADAVGVIAELNTALRRVAVEHGAAVAEIAEHFHGHGLLAGDPTRREARPAERDLWFCNLIEPNAWGADGVRSAFWTAAHPHDAPRR